MFNLSFIKKIKKKIFPFYRNKKLKFVFKKLKINFPSQTNTAMFVGGCVRKHLLNEEIDDIDIATSLTTDEVKEKFKDTEFNIVDSGLKHGTITLISDKLKLELTTLRKDIKTDGRHAEIEYTDNWYEDSARRDFTINAIYLDINGKLFDPQSGIADLKKRTVKFIGDPQKRIEEDYLRIIRFIRFSLEYQSEIEHSTIQAVKLNINGIKKISKERILTELFKTVSTKNFTKLNTNKFLKEIFLLIFPELKYVERLDRLDLIDKEINFNKNFLLALLLIDQTDNQEYFSHKYNVSNDLKNNLNLLASNFSNIKKNKKYFQSELKKNIFYFGKTHLKQLNTLNFLASKNIKMKDYLNTMNIIEKISLPKLPFDGQFLKNRGIKEGVIMGKILRSLENDWVNNDFKISDQRISKIINHQK